MSVAQSAPAAPVDAATVIVLRGTLGQPEIFCVERHVRSAFMGGVLVFPGGKVDPADRGAEWDSLATPLSERAASFAVEYDVARSFAVAALREALEEASILPVAGDGLDARAALTLRERLARGESFPKLLGEADFVLDTARLEPLGRWITPPEEPRRFDTKFYVFALPPSQDGAHDGRETTQSFWATAKDILARWEAGEVRLSPPTTWMLELFTDVADVSSALAVAKRQSLAPVLPRFVQTSGQTLITLPGDPLHPDSTALPVSEGNPTRFVLDDGRFVPCRG